MMAQLSQQLGRGWAVDAGRCSAARAWPAWPSGRAACSLRAARRARRSRRASCVSTDLSDGGKSIVFSNWIGYVDPVKREDTSTLEKFQQETGITVT